MPDRTFEGSGVTPVLPPLLGDLPDVLLVERARQGDARAFEGLMRRYNRRLFRIARSVLRDDDAAEDAVQEAYLSAFTHLHRYEPTGRFSAWLSRIAMNEALMIRRKTRPGMLSFDELGDAKVDAATFAQHEPAPDHVESEQARQLLERAIDTLPESFRMVFVLRMVEQLSISETASCLALTEATVRTRLHRAQRLLRAHLARRLGREQLNAFDFGASRCDSIVNHVLSRLRQAGLVQELPS